MAQPNKNLQKNPATDDEILDDDLDTAAGGAINPIGSAGKTPPIIIRPTNPVPDGPQSPTPVNPDGGGIKGQDPKKGGGSPLNPIR